MPTMMDNQFELNGAQFIELFSNRGAYGRPASAYSKLYPTTMHLCVLVNSL